MNQAEIKSRESNGSKKTKLDAIVIGAGIAGLSTFKGVITHTGLWPKGGVDLKGKRVAVVGTGATGIQVIQTIAAEVGSMKVFVRTPQYIVPMRNPKYSQADWDRWSGRFN